jgi:antitoxin component HigA of HigAB toxin-antitoxin module
MARQVTILKSEAEYEKALDEIERFFETEPRPGTPEAERFDDLADAIAQYEGQHWSLDESRAQVGDVQSRRAAVRRDRKH